MAVAVRSPAEIRTEMERMYQQHAQAVLRAVARDTGSTELAWDALHEAFIVAQRKLADGQAIRNEEAFLLVTARRKARSSKARQAGESELAETLAGGDDIEQAATAGASLIWEACRRLKPQFRIAVLMHDAEDQSSDEIGRYLGTSRDSAVKLVQRGRKEMLARLVELVGRRRGCPPECADLATLIWSWISNELDFEARERLRAHVSSCDYCRETAEQLRQARSLGVLPLLIPLAEVFRRRDQILSVIQTRRVSSRIALHLRPTMLAAPLLILLIIGVVNLPVRLPPITLKPGTQPVAALDSPSASSTPSVASPSSAPSPSPTPVASAVPVSSPAVAKPPPDPCPTGTLGGFAYLSAGRVMYRSSPRASSQVLDGTGRADDLRWTPNGATLVYKEVPASGSVAGSLHAVHPGGAPFWSFGSDIESYDISTDGGSIVALAQHYDAAGNWDAWTLYIGPLGGTLTAHTVSASVGPDWS